MSNFDEQRTKMALHHPAGWGLHETLACLIRKTLEREGANGLEHGDTDGLTPLHRAAMNGRPACVAMLLQAGASTKATHKYGATPLEEAIAWRIRLAFQKTPNRIADYDECIRLLTPSL